MRVGTGRHGDRKSSNEHTTAGMITLFIAVFKIIERRSEAAAPQWNQCRPEVAIHLRKSRPEVASHPKKRALHPFEKRRRSVPRSS